MSRRDLPPRAHLDHLRNEAKAVHRAFHARDAIAIQLIRDVLGDTASTSPLKLTDAQRVIARGYGFATWARLRAHVVALRSFDDAVIAFLATVDSQDADAANRVLHAQPHIACDSLHVAAVLGNVDHVRRLIAEDPARVAARAGDPPAEPLLLLCHSPFHGESTKRDAALLATAQLLLDVGADPTPPSDRVSTRQSRGVRCGGGDARARWRGDAAAATGRQIARRVRTRRFMVARRSCAPCSRPAPTSPSAIRNTTPPHSAGQRSARTPSRTPRATTRPQFWHSSMPGRGGMKKSIGRDTRAFKQY